MSFTNIPSVYYEWWMDEDDVIPPKGLLWQHLTRGADRIARVVQLRRFLPDLIFEHCNSEAYAYGRRGWGEHRLRELVDELPDELRQDGAAVIWRGWRDGKAGRQESIAPGGYTHFAKFAALALMDWIEKYGDWNGSAFELARHLPIMTPQHWSQWIGRMELRRGRRRRIRERGRWRPREWIRRADLKWLISKMEAAQQRLDNEAIERGRPGRPRGIVKAWLAVARRGGQLASIAWNALNAKKGGVSLVERQGLDLEEIRAAVFEWPPPARY